MTRRHIHAEGPGLRPNSMGIWRNEAGFLLYEDAEDIQPGDHVLADLPEEERDRNCHEAYQFLIRQHDLTWEEWLATCVIKTEQPTTKEGRHEDFDWEEAESAPVLVIRRAWDR
jgi:hypothetical protein